jgi:ribosomal protein S18 acetylase RimI-like enzyme
MACFSLARTRDGAGGRVGADTVLVDLTIGPFDPAQTERVLAWVGSVEELERWASRTDFPLGAAVFRRWHEDLDVHPVLGIEDGEPVAYGEIWEDRDEHEAELARIVVDPRARGRGVGRRFVTLLTAAARERGFEQVWLRVVPENDPAIRCYEHAGFRRASAADEGAFNAGKPRPYLWMFAGSAEPVLT